MRIHLIPISARRTLIYGQRLNQITHPQPSLVDRAAIKATNMWHAWENGKKAWQKKVTVYGNKLMSRIPFEEWSLKSIPPLSARRERAEIEGKKIEVVYPPSVIDEKNIPLTIKKLVAERMGLHRSRLIWSLVGMPIVSPLALVPLIPNIPFFYLLYRAFSHWKALAGAKHLEFLVEHNLLKPTPSMALDSIYRRNQLKSASEKSQKQSEKSKGTKEDSQPDRLLISKGDAKDVAATLDLPSITTEVERACQQVATAMNKEAQTKKAQAADRG